MADPTVPFEALSAPLGDLVAAVGRGVAEAQRALDTATVDAIRDLYASQEATVVELQRLGWRPTWYQIPEAEAEISVALSVTAEQSSETRGRVKLYGAPMDASYTNRFGYTLAAQSKLRFRIVPVPAPLPAEGATVVPDLSGLTLAQARARLTELGIAHAFEGSTVDTATVLATNVAPGLVLAGGATLVVTVQPPRKTPKTPTLSTSPVK